MKLAINGGEPIIRKEPPPNWPIGTSETINSLLKVINSKRWAISSPYNSDNCLFARKFARKFANFLGVKHCVTTSSGSSALTIALEALDIGVGDEVILPALTWVADATAILNVNAFPVFVDVEKSAPCIAPSEIRKSITRSTKAIIVVHLYSTICNIDELLKIAKEYDLYLIEDCSHVHGAKWKGKYAGTFGQCGVFSMQQSKVLTSGEGGAVITDSNKIAIRLEQLRADGRIYTKKAISGKLELEERGEVMGTNYCLSEFQSAILLDQLSRLELQNKIRLNNALYLDSVISKIPGLKPFVPPKQVTFPIYYYYLIQYFPEVWDNIPIDVFARALSAELKFPIKRLYPPIYRSKLFAPLSKKRYKVSEEVIKKLGKLKHLNLPNSEYFYDSYIGIHHSFLLNSRDKIKFLPMALQKLYSNKEELKGFYSYDTSHSSLHNKE